MRMHSLFLGLCFLSVYQFISAQSDFRPGYIIDNNSDTIRGYLDYRGDLRNARKCVFRTELNSKSISYSPTEISAYRFLEGKFYISRQIQRDQGEEWYFLEYLVNGISNLYYYRSDLNNHYLIEKDDGELIELTNLESLSTEAGKTYLKESNKYIGLLKAAFADCSEIQEDIKNASLTHKSLITLSSDYHNYVCEDEACIVYAKEIPLAKHTFSPIFGVAYASFDTESQLATNNFEFGSVFTPLAGIRLNISSPRLNEKMAFQLESLISYERYFSSSYFENSAFASYIDASILVSFLHSSILYKYTYPKGRLKPTIGIGGVSSILLWEKSSYAIETITENAIFVDEYSVIPIKKFLWGAMVQVGVKYQAKFGGEILFQFRYQNCKGSDAALNTRHQMVSLVAGVLF